MTGFCGYKIRVDDMVQLALKTPKGSPGLDYVLAPRVYMVSAFVHARVGESLNVPCKLSNGLVQNSEHLVRADAANEIIGSHFGLLRYPTLQESTFKVDPMLDDRELKFLMDLRDKPGKAGTLKDPVEQMSDMLKHLVQRGYCRTAEECIGPLRIKSGAHMILLTEAGEIAMNAQLISSSKNMESLAYYECPQGHEMVKFKNGQPVCPICESGMRRIS